MAGVNTNSAELQMHENHMLEGANSDDEIFTQALSADNNSNPSSLNLSQLENENVSVADKL